MTDCRFSRLLTKLEIPLLLAVPAVMATALLAGVEQAALAMLVVVALVLALFFAGYEASRPGLRQIMPTLVLAALAGGAWSLPGWRCWRPAACLAHGRARLFGSLALVLVLFIGWRLWPAPGRYTPPPVSYPSRRTRPTPPRLAPAPARACPSCRRAPVLPSPDGPPKIATARRRGYLPRPVSSPGKLC